MRAAALSLLFLFAHAASEGCDGSDPDVAACSLRDRSLLQTGGSSGVANHQEDVNEEDAEEGYLGDEPYPDSVQEVHNEALSEMDASVEEGVNSSKSNTLMAHWRFNEDHGHSVKDESGNGRDLPLYQWWHEHATGHPHAWPEIQAGKGLDGSGAVYFHPRSYAGSYQHGYKLPKFMAVSFWIKRDADCPYIFNPIVEVLRYGTGFPERNYLKVQMRHGFRAGTIGAYAWLPNGDHAQAHHPIGDAHSKGWQHIAVSLGPRIIFYLDGVKTVSGPLRGEMGPEDLSLRIGTWIHHPYKGLVDEFRVYKEPLSDAMVSAIRAARGGNL